MKTNFGQAFLEFIIFTTIGTFAHYYIHFLVGWVILWYPAVRILRHFIIQGWKRIFG